MRQSPYQTHPDPPWSGFEPITLPIVAPTDRFQVAAPQAESVRSPVLGGHSSDLDQLVRSTHSRQARYGSLLASRRIPPVLDMAIPPAASGAAPERNRKTTWKEFLTRHWELIVAADFFTIEVWTNKGLT